ncbi:hypothetical protein HPT29_015360 [Microvirga terrae]|uniref:Uncharacterized protein n=1 Tax=Microvirga terrae TaxID=2740529 RepID=A0ABY5RL01_9HYPH|nr:MULTISPECIES: hypothetical protein [Microvirga]MBQ0823088.1 hypothetical protein [Microvirga sp. HBU67558]UVF17896.1 hypothetical protein HPT29_015360 [Microvirga terrae]
MTDVKATDDRSHQDLDAGSIRHEGRTAPSLADVAAPVVLTIDDLAFATGGLLTRKVNEYEGQHR